MASAHGVATRVLCIVAHSLLLLGDVALGAADQPPASYDPEALLCAPGGKLQGWCRDWLACVKAKALPGMNASAVLDAWKPADCKEICGHWPTGGSESNAPSPALPSDRNAPSPASPLDANLLVNSFRLQNDKPARHNLRLPQVSDGDCLASCKNFQRSLSSCVSTILFEPGKLAGMAPQKQETSKLPSQCSARNTVCMPDLTIRYQKCLARAAKPQKTCDVLKAHVDMCKDCPQLGDNYVSHYHAFVGGCMDQLNAYWQATHPEAGLAAIPGASGCAVH